MDLLTNYNSYIFYIVLIWSMAWKGIALWKSSKRTEIVWFISILILNAIGVLEIGYIYLFSKIKDAKQFKKTHDILLIIAAVSAILSLPIPSLRIILVVAMAFFGISILQKIVDNKNRNWIILGIIFNPVVTIIYYFKKIRNQVK